MQWMHEPEMMVSFSFTAWFDEDRCWRNWQFYPQDELMSPPVKLISYSTQLNHRIDISYICHNLPFLPIHPFFDQQEPITNIT